MRREPRTKHALRCFCSRSPMLAMYGIDVDEKLYVHVMVHKQHRVFGNIVVYSGEVVIQCRECIRWHRVVIRDQRRAVLEETRQPEVISEESDI